METRILAEMKIENHGKNFFSWKKIDKHTFSPMKIKIIDLETQIEARKLIFIMNFSKISSSLPPECLKLHRF